jgi:hypothetical protein
MERDAGHIATASRRCFCCCDNCFCAVLAADMPLLSRCYLAVFGWPEIRKGV